MSHLLPRLYDDDDDDAGDNDNDNDNNNNSVTRTDVVQLLIHYQVVLTDVSRCWLISWFSVLRVVGCNCSSKVC